MRVIAHSLILFSLAAPAAAQMHPDDARAAQGWPSRSAAETIEAERWYPKVAAGFGDCIVTQNPAEAQSFADAASRRARTPRSPALAAAIKTCLPEHQRAGQFSTEQQNTAIYRAVLRKNGKPAPS